MRMSLTCIFTEESKYAEEFIWANEIEQIKAWEQKIAGQEALKFSLYFFSNIE